VDEADAFAVTLVLTLTRRESNELFLCGDSMISWPSEGLHVQGDPVPARTSIFVSEIAARPNGMTLRYVTRRQADSTAGLLLEQFGQLGIPREEQ
jgi:hypothetical protein